MRNLNSRWFRSDRAFREQLQAGNDAEDQVLKALIRSGIPARGGDRGFRRGLAQRHAWRNQADIWVEWFDAGGRPTALRLEVKSSRFLFVVPGDWPADKVLIEPVWKLDAKQPKPIAYVLVSRPTRAMLAVGLKALGVTRDADVKRKTREDWYFAQPSDLQSWGDLIQYLQRRMK